MLIGIQFVSWVAAGRAKQKPLLVPLLPVVVEVVDLSFPLQLHEHEQHAKLGSYCKISIAPNQPEVKTVFLALTCTLPTAESCRACLGREQAPRNLTEDLLVVGGYRPLHMNTSALYARFLRQPFELTLKKDFQLLWCQDGNGNSRGLAGIGLDPDAVWGFRLLRFWSHATPPFWSDESGTEES
jgi:hypothetical protein